MSSTGAVHCVVKELNGNGHAEGVRQWRARMSTVRIYLIALAASLWLAAPAASAPPGSSLADDAIAILEKNCLACHGSAQMSGLDLRQRGGVLQGGSRGPAVEPGKAAESLLYQVAAHVGDLIMPPGSEEPLPAADLETLSEWINHGAPWLKRKIQLDVHRSTEISSNQSFSDATDQLRPTAQNSERHSPPRSHFQLPRRENS